MTAVVKTSFQGFSIACADPSDGDQELRALASLYRMVGYR